MMAPLDSVYLSMTFTSSYRPGPMKQKTKPGIRKTEDIDSTENTEQLVEDAEYVADYFLESISMRDYVGAYTLLGSKMQAGVSYSDFRERFIHYVNLEYSDLESKATDDGRVETSLSVTAEKTCQMKRKRNRKRSPTCSPSDTKTISSKY